MSSNGYTNGHTTVRKSNFGAGPAQLPLEVDELCVELKKIDELI